MKTSTRVTIGEQRKSRVGWSCEAQVDGVRYEVSLIVIRNGTPQPDTWGAVRRVGVTGRSLWEDRVPASISPREILSLAGIPGGSGDLRSGHRATTTQRDRNAIAAGTPGSRESEDPLEALRGKFKIEESRLTERHGARVRSGLLTVGCERCTVSWTVQVRADGAIHPDAIQRLLDHHRGH